MAFVRNFRQCSTLFIHHLNRISTKSRPLCVYPLQYIKGNYFGASYRALSIQRAENYSDYIPEKSEASLACYQISNSLKKFGAIQKDNIADLHNAILKSKIQSISNSLFLLQCCGNAAALENFETRNKMVTDIWNSFLANDYTLDISHYNTLLQVFLENEYEFSPLEFLASLQEKNINPNRVTFSRLIAKYCENGDVEGANKILQFLKAEELTVTENVFNSLIIGYARAGDFDGASGIVELMKESNLSPGPDTYAALLQAYGELNNVESFASLLKKLDSDEIFITDGALLEVIYSLAMKEKDEQIPEILSRIKKSTGFVPQAINVICRLLYTGRDEVAFEIFKTVPPHSDLQYNSQYFPRILARANIPLTKLVSYCQELKSSHHNVHSFENALEGLLLNGDVEKTLSFLRAMRENGVDIREHYIYPLFCSLRDVADTQNTYEAFKLMSELDLKLSSLFFKNYLLPSLIHTSNISDISDIFVNLLKLGTNYQITSLYNGMIDYLINEHGLEIAAKFVKEFRRGIRLPIMSLALAYLSTYNVEDTLCILRQMLPFNITKGEIDNPEKNDYEYNFENIFKVLSYIINGLKSRNEFDNQFPVLLEGMLHKGIGIDNLTAEEIKKKIGSGNMTSSIEKLLSKLTNPALISTTNKSLSSRILEIENKGEDSPLELKYALVKLYFAKGEREKALKLIESLKEEGVEIPSSTMVLLARIYLDENNLEEARGIFNNLKNECPQFQISASVICKYINSLVIADNIQEAVQACLMHSPEDGKWPVDLSPEINDRDYRNRIMKTLGLIVEKKDFSSLQLLQEALLTRNFAQPATILTSLLRFHLQDGNLQKAVEAFESIFNEHKVTVSKSELTVACIEKEDTDNLQKILDISNIVHGEMNTLFDLAVSFIETGKLRQAKKVLETPGLKVNQVRFDDHCQMFINNHNKPIDALENLVTLSKSVFNVNRQRLYGYLLKAYIARDDPDKALGVWLTMQEESITPSESFLYELGHFLKSKEKSVPFVIPSLGYQTSVAKPQIAPKKLEKNMSEESVKPKQPSSTVRSYLDQGNLEAALTYAKEVWNSGNSLTRNELNSLFSKLSEAGDYQSIEFAVKYLEPKLLKDIQSNIKLVLAYRNADKIEDLLNKVLQQYTEEENASTVYNIPYFIIKSIFSEKNELIPLVEKCAELGIEKGNKKTMANIMNVYLALGKEEEANKIYDNYFQNDQVIDIYGFCNEEGFRNKNHQIFDSAIKLLNKHPDGRENVIAVVYSIRVDLLCQEGKYEEAVTLINRCISKPNFTLQHMRGNSLNNLRKAMKQANMPFPFSITEQKKEDSSSSSSNSDEEK